MTSSFTRIFKLNNLGDILNFPFSLMSSVSSKPTQMNVCLLLIMHLEILFNIFPPVYFCYHHLCSGPYHVVPEIL